MACTIANIAFFRAKYKKEITKSVRQKAGVTDGTTCHHVRVPGARTGRVCVLGARTR